ESTHVPGSGEHHRGGRRDGQRRVPRDGATRARVAHHARQAALSAVIPDSAATPASQARSHRLWIWAALGLKLLAYVVDFAWHGLASPGAEPATRSDMIRHLITVHAPLYIGAACVLITILRAMVHRAGQSATPAAPHALAIGPLAVALAGAVISVSAEAWHAWSHVHLDTHHAPLAGGVLLAGYLVGPGGPAVGAARGRGPGARFVG